MTHDPNDSLRDSPDEFSRPSEDYECVSCGAEATTAVDVAGHGAVPACARCARNAARVGYAAACNERSYGDPYLDDVEGSEP
jgi:NMD protein affecting ribosome stability and mRNA decay